MTLTRCPNCNIYMLSERHQCPPRWLVCPAAEYLRQQQMRESERDIPWASVYAQEPFVAAEEYARDYMQDADGEIAHIDLAVRGPGNDARVRYLRVTREVAYSYRFQSIEPDEVERT